MTTPHSHSIEIQGRTIGPGQPTFIVAEISANHDQEYEKAVELFHAAKAAGADAVKLQTYTADTLTIRSDSPLFKVSGGLWDGHTLYDLYEEAHTPWKWQPKLKQVADELGLVFFSSPFDDSAVDFLEAMAVPAHKIASFELVDTALLQKVARTGKPIIMSTGMATLAEIGEAVTTLREAGADQIALLKCTSAYPASPEEMNLETIPHLSAGFAVPVGLSDHTMGFVVPIAAVALGACIIEKHVTLSRDAPGPDSAFSMEPQEFKAMVDGVRIAEKALGRVHYGVSEKEAQSRIFRRSLFVVQDVAAGDLFNKGNVRSIRPGHGLEPKYLNRILGRRANRNLRRGTPLDWSFVS